MSTPFYPAPGTNQIVSVSTISASTTIDLMCKSIRFINLSENICYVRMGNEPQIATSADTPILPGKSLVLTNSYTNVVAYVVPTDSENNGMISGFLHIQTGRYG